MRITAQLAVTSLIAGALVVTAGCGTASSGSKGTTVHMVQVGPKIEPLQINAGKDHEVRWINKRSQPIAVIFPRSDDPRISCRTGFKKIGGVLSAEIAPNASASMCFSELGKYDYRIRLDENQPAAETDRNASVLVVARGERNPKPGEQFENITP